MDTKNFVYSIISSKTGLKNISDTQKLHDDLGLDSLDQLELIMQIEDKYNMREVDSTKAATIKTVGDLIDVIEATDTQPVNSKPAISAPGTPSLYTMKANIPYCRITDKKCDKMRPTMGIINFNDCHPEKCRIAKNVFNIIREVQKTK